MEKLKNSISEIIWASLAIMIVVFVLAISGVDDGRYVTQQVEAGSAHNLSGYAWSDNIGWISFNCSDAGTCGNVNYGVNVEENGDLSGYAWSDNIGWISFNEGELAGCPVGACKAKLEGNDLKGWAKALAGDDADDGWDGWISLDCAIAGVCGDSDYGAVLNGADFEGYAWGDEVIGWIQFNSDFGGVVFDDGERARIDSFAVSTVATGNNPRANWTTQNVNRCEGDWTVDDVCSSTEECASVSGLLIDQPVMFETTYILTCYGDDADDTASFTPLEYFELAGDPLTIKVEFAGGGATTTPTTISVFSMNGFQDNIVLSTNLGSLPVGSADEFSDQTLSYSEFGVGSQLEIYVVEPIDNSRIIEVLGNDDVSRKLEITINTAGVVPIYIEI